jgi:hypothetical protein
MNSTLPNCFIKVASVLIISIAFISCSSKQKNAQPTTPATTAAQKDATKNATPTTAATKTKAVVCKNGADTRTIDVAVKDAGCQVVYTKFGQTTNPASSVKGTSHCESVVAKIKGNLESSGFKCE